MIECNETRGLYFNKKCELLKVPRSSMYYKPKTQGNNDFELLHTIRDIYAECPMYGYRRIHVELRRRGIEVNHKRVQRVLSAANIKALYPMKKKNTSIRNLKHKVYPYLLDSLDIKSPNQAWSVDITYIKIRMGFVYLVCLIDIFSRKIMGWDLSTSLDATSCISACKQALKISLPDIINSDQGCQFTSDLWVDILKQNGIRISMDGKGRWVDNKYVERLWRTVKYESVFLHSFDSVYQARNTLSKFIVFYNENRPHQSLNYHTPEVIYDLGIIPTKQQLFESFRVQNQQRFTGASMTL